MTDHTQAAAHYAIQHEHANELNELKRLREVNAELVAALRGLIRAGHGLSSASIEWNAAHAALAKASK